MGAPTTAKRVWVIIAAVILLAFAIVAISQCHNGYNTFCLVVNVITIVGAILGIIGALRLHAGMLNVFCVSLVLLIILEIIFIILAFTDGGVSGRDILWDFIVLGLLTITLFFAADLRNALTGAVILA